MDIKIETIDKPHPRDAFDCGIDQLNAFLNKYARQNQKNNISKTYVAIPNGEKNIIGYYTITSGHIDFDALPPNNKHPSYPVSIARIARLAVDLKSHGQGIGGYLLYDALTKIKAASEIIGIYAVVVDAKETSKSFYTNYGFINLQKSQNTLFLPMKTIDQLIT